MSNDKNISEIEDEFRSIISHALLGCDTSDISKETFDLCISECAKYASQLHPSPTPPVEDGKLGGESKEQIFEKCRLYAEDLMYSKSWDRKDAEMVGVFYKFFIDKLWEYLKSQPSTPSAEDGWVSVKDVTDITDPTQICPELDYKISRFSRDLIDTVMESYAMGDSYIKRDHKVFKLVFYFINTINHPLPSPPVNKQPL